MKREKLIKAYFLHKVVTVRLSRDGRTGRIAGSARQLPGSEE